MLSPMVRLVNRLAWRSADTRLVAARHAPTVPERAPTSTCARGPLEAGDGAHELARARSFHAHDGHDLPDLHVQVDPVELPAGVRPAGEPQAGAGAFGARRGRFVGLVRRLPADEPGGDAVRGQRLALEQVGADAVEDQRDAVGVLRELGDPMGHQEHDVAGIGEQVHPAEEVLRLLLGQRGVRLIEEEDPRVAGQRATDLDALLDRQRDVARACGRRTSRMARSRMSARSCAFRRRTSARVLSRPTMRFSATLRFGNSCGSWWTTATRSRSVARIPRTHRPARSPRRPPWSRRRGP